MAWPPTSPVDRAASPIVREHTESEKTFELGFGRDVFRDWFHDEDTTFFSGDHIVRLLQALKETTDGRIFGFLRLALQVAGSRGVLLVFILVAHAIRIDWECNSSERSRDDRASPSWQSEIESSISHGA